MTTVWHAKGLQLSPAVKAQKQRKNDDKNTENFVQLDTLHNFYFHKGGAVAQSVERATPGEEVPGSIPAVAARSLLVGSVSV